MRDSFFTIFKILVALVLIGKILNWFMKFGDTINELLNMIMFILIGIAYLVMGYIWENRFLKAVVTSCGVFLIAMNFINKNVILDIAGIICILTPMLIARIHKDKRDEMNVVES